MKFIRDIIAEKTSLSDARNDAGDPEIRDDPETLSDDIDPVNMVASGATSLGRTGQFSAFTDDEPDQGNSQGLHGQDTELEAEDDFDQLSDSGGDEKDDVSTVAQRQQPSELFADIWDDDGNQRDYTEDDIFAAIVSEPKSREVPLAEPEPEPAETEPESTMSAMEPPEPASSDEPWPEPVIQSAAQDVQAPPPEPEPDSAPESSAESSPEPGSSSAYQKILRRQQSIPPEFQSESGPEFEPAPETEPAPDVVQAPVAPVQMPAPAEGRTRRQAGRVKTRLLGFGNEFGREQDLFVKDDQVKSSGHTMFPVGWMVVVSGPGRGNGFTLFSGVSQIGRGEDQAVRLDFGDNSISRSNHAAIAYDPEQKGFYLGHGGKANLVRLNGNPVLSTEPLSTGALIRIGETTLRFVGLCGDEFDWGKSDGEEGENAQFD